jgi:glycosyltransferase involved in cell wall biosynthesis
LKILFPFVGDSVGGSHISTLELYSSLIDENITVLIVLHKDNGPLSQYLSDKNIPFYILKSSKLAGETSGKLSIIIGIMTNFFHFSKFIKSHKIDIVHGNDLRINLSWSLPAKFVAKGFVWHQRTLLSDSKLWLLIRYLCDYFVAISDVVMQSAPLNIQDGQKKIIYNPFNVHSSINKELERKYTIEKYSFPQDSFLIGCVGRIVDYKNINFMIKNIFDIRNRLNKNVYLIVVGTGPEEYINELKKYANSLGVSSYIIFTGFLKNPHKILTSLDLLVAPSLIDAFGRSIIEAMLQKTPVLAAKSGGHMNIINDGVNGMFYEPTIENDFIKKISIIMNMTNISAISDNAYQFAQFKFSPKQHLDNILPIYQNLLIS